jgi:hypothetical protein
MMLLSRVVFQAAGARRMRAFLDGWQRGSVKRVWGLGTLAFAGFLAGCAIAASGRFTTFELVLLATLLAVLVADGAVNALPSGFETFKDRLQAAWVRRSRPGRDGDPHLFGTVNALLAAAAGGVAAIVLAYRPIGTAPVVAAVVAAFVLTPALIGASVLTARHR